MFQSLRIKLIVVGKTKTSYIQQGVDDFLKRLSRYAQVEMTVVKPVVKHPEGQILTLEGENLLKKVAPDDYVVALDRKGRQFNSEQFSRFFVECMNKGRSHIAFIIGGQLGLAEDVQQKANMVLSLSAMTFTHDMSRLILLEQIYRAMTILHGEPYHR